MPALREQDFDKLATEVVDQFLSGQQKLADAAAKTAMEHRLNPDQIERLVQSANTMTFLRMMDQRKQAGAGDLMHEFDPIDSRNVIRIVIDASGVHINPPETAPSDKMTDSDENELPDEMSAMRMNPAEGEPGHTDSPKVEECEEECHDKHDPPGIKTKRKAPATKDEEEEKLETPKQAALRKTRMRKLAGILEDQVHQAEWTFEDVFAKLASRFKLVHNETTYAAFEKDALAEHSDEVGVSVLNLMRTERGLTPLDGSTMQKVAALADHHISLETPELHLFETLVKVANEAAKIQRGLAWMKDQCA